MTQFVFTNAGGKIVTIKNPDTNTQNLDIDLSKIVVADAVGNILAKDLSFKKSPINITSWSYVGTTITLNVASHTFVAGDYIKTKGLISTTYPANGVYLVTSVTATTIVFTNFTTPTGTTGVSTATVNGFTTLNGSILGNTNVNKIQYENDFIYLGDGRILQYGTSKAVTVANSYQLVTLPIQFPNACIFANGSSLSLGSYGGAGKSGATGVAVWGNNIGAVINYIAIGY